MFLVLCPKCKNKMRYESRTKYPANKRKRCVYCGKSFKVTYTIIRKF